MLNDVSIIAFDLDDTLWPCMPTIRHAEQTLFQWLTQHYPRITERYDLLQLNELRRQFGRRDQRYAIDVTAMRADFLQHLGDSHNYDGKRLSSDGFGVFFNARQQVEFYADVLPSLERLGQRFRLGAISNGNASVEHVGLGHLFEYAVSAVDVQAAKPDRLIYDHFAARVEAAPEQIAYIGDHPEYDVVGARQAGYHAVWINRERLQWPDHLPAPKHEVSDLFEFEKLLSE